MWNEEKQMNWMKKRRGRNLEREEKRRERLLGPHANEKHRVDKFANDFCFCAFDCRSGSHKMDQTLIHQSA